MASTLVTTALVRDATSNSVSRKTGSIAGDELARAEGRRGTRSVRPRRPPEHESGNGSVVGRGRAKLVDGLESQLHRDATALYSGIARRDCGAVLSFLQSVGDGRRQGMTAKRGTKATRGNTDGTRVRPLLAPHRARQRSDDGNAFMPDPEDGPARIRDDLAENLAEDYLQAATQGMEVEEDARPDRARGDRRTLRRDQRPRRSSRTTPTRPIRRTRRASRCRAPSPAW